MAELDRFYQQAEFLILKGYVPANTDISEMAVKLLNIAKNETSPANDCMTRETVYGDPETIAIIDDIVKKTQPVHKMIINDGERESAALKHSMDTNKNSE